MKAGEVMMPGTVPAGHRLLITPRLLFGELLEVFLDAAAIGGRKAGWVYVGYFGLVFFFGEPIGGLEQPRARTRFCPQLNECRSGVDVRGGEVDRRPPRPSGHIVVDDGVQAAKQLLQIARSRGARRSVP